MRIIIDDKHNSGKDIEVLCQGIVYKSVTADDILDFMRVILNVAGINVKGEQNAGK